MRVDVTMSKHSNPCKIIIASVLLLPLTVVAGDSSWSWFSLKRMKGVAPVSNADYQRECSACHFAYQPGLLPKRSWQKLLAAEALADHFNENAELDEAVQQQITAYALENAADTSNYKRSRKVMSSLNNDEAPLRIIEVPYIKQKHEKIPSKYIVGNPEVQSLSNCNNCHTQAEKGVFDDDTVYIKGYGRWHD